ncbi:MAG: DciA family protein [Candidatus Wallbacteria bacterium]|nr:DciA family protein [Candidatus Wallbacteria bacterium]
MKPVEEIFSIMLASNPGLDAVLSCHRADEIWAKIGGPMKNDLHVEGLRNGVLSMTGHNHLYLYHLKQMKTDLINSFNRELGRDEVKDIRFRLSCPARQEKTESSAPDRWKEFFASYRVQEKVLREIDAAVSGIEDEELRKRIFSYLTRAHIYERFRNAES